MNYTIEVQDMFFIRKDVACVQAVNGIVTIRLKDQEIRHITEEEWYGIEHFFSESLISRIRQYYREYHQRSDDDNSLIVVCLF